MEYKCDCGNPDCTAEQDVAEVERLLTVGGVTALTNWAVLSLKETDKDGFPEKYQDRLFAAMMVMSRRAQAGNLGPLTVFVRNIREATPEEYKPLITAFLQNTSADLCRVVFEVAEYKARQLCEAMGTTPPQVHKVQKEREVEDLPAQPEKYSVH